MDNCFLNYVGIRKACDVGVPLPSSGLYVDDLVGVNLLKAASFASMNDVSGKNLLIRTGQEAAVQLIGDIESIISARGFNFLRYNEKLKSPIIYKELRLFKNINVNVTFPNTTVAGFVQLFADGNLSASIPIQVGLNGSTVFAFATPVTAKNLSVQVIGNMANDIYICVQTSCSLCTFFERGYFITAFRHLWAAMIELEGIKGTTLTKGSDDLYNYQMNLYNERMKTEANGIDRKLIDCTSCQETLQVVSILT